MKIYEYIINHLPTVYRSEKNTDIQIRLWADMFNQVLKEVEIFEKLYTIENANLEELRLFGRNVGRDIKDLETIEIYRNVLKIEYFKYLNIPTHDNMLKISEQVVGSYPLLIPTTQINGQVNNSDLSYNLSYFVDLHYPTQILEALKEIYPVGVKLDQGNFVSGLKSEDLLQAMIYYDFKTMTIKGIL